MNITTKLQTGTALAVACSVLLGCSPANQTDDAKTPRATTAGDLAAAIQRLEASNNRLVKSSWENGACWGAIAAAEFVRYGTNVSVGVIVDRAKTLRDEADKPKAP